MVKAYPDTCVGTDSHTTMENGLGVLGWGVGGIEAEAAMLGQPVSMLIPRVVGFKLTGEIKPGVTATDVVLTVTDMLRKHGVVGKFVEFYGKGVAEVPLANRATLGNMSPEFGSTAAMFPIDEETINYLRLTGRSDEQLALVEAYAKTQGMWHNPDARAGLLRVHGAGPVHRGALDLRPEAPAGPHRAHRRQERVPQGHPQLRRGEPTRRSTPSSTRPSRSPSRPATPASLSFADDGAVDARPSAANGAEGRPSKPVTVRSEERGEFVLDHGAVVVAGITSCTNTSNPSVMIGAALLAKKAVEKGLTSKPWVKTNMAPGIAGRHRLLQQGRPVAVPGEARLLPGRLRLHHLHRQHRPAARRDLGKAINENDLSVTAVLSGNRNFEGRISPDVKMNYLASPPLVIAYGIAGTMDFDFESDPLGQDTTATTSSSRTSGRPRPGDRGDHRVLDQPGHVHRVLRRRVQGRRPLAFAADPGGQHLRLGRGLDLRAQGALLRRHARRSGAGQRHHRRQSACPAG